MKLIAKYNTGRLLRCGTPPIYGADSSYAVVRNLAHRMQNYAEEAIARGPVQVDAPEAGDAVPAEEGSQPQPPSQR